MSRRVNYRLLLITLAVFAVAAGIFHGLHVWQFNRHVATLLAYAREAKTQNRPDQAIALYEQYLKQEPGDLDAQEELALTLDATARSPQERNTIVQMLEKLLLKSSDRKALRWRLIENEILLHRYGDAVRHLDFLRNTATDKADIDHKRGWCLDAAGKYDQAVQAFQKAVDADPKRINSWALLAEVQHQRQSRDVEAQQTLDKMIELNPDSAAAALVRFRYRVMVGRDAEAAADLAEARKLAPKDADVILSACQFAQAKGKFAEARKLVAEGITLYPANAAMIKELAHLELREGQRAAALKTIEDGLKALPKTAKIGDLQIFHADILIDLEKTKEAQAIIAELRSDGWKPALPDFLQARILVQQKHWSEAQALLEKSRKALGSDPYWSSRINSLLGLCVGQLGDGERQLQYFLEAARAEPRWAALNLNIGQAFLDAGNPEQAITYLQPLLDDPDAPPQARALIARARYRVMMAVPERDRRWKEVEESIAVAERANPGSLDLVLLRADLLQAQRKGDAARKLLTADIDRRKADPKADNVALWIALADLEAKAGNFDRADEILKSANKSFGDLVPIRVAKARVLVHRGRSDDRDAIKALSENVEAFSAEDRGRLDRELAELWLQQGDMTTAKTLLVAATGEMPRDLRSRALLLELALQSDQLDEARKWLKEMQDLEGPSGPQSAYAALQIRADENHGKPAELRKMLADLKSSPLRKGDGRLELIESRIHDRLGEKDKSLAKLVDAVNAGQRAPRVLQRLVQLLGEQKQYDQLAWALSLLEGRGPMPRETGRASVDTALVTGNIEMAKELIAPVNLTAIRDYRELLWLASIYQKLDDPSLAEQALRRAVAMAPYAPDAWVALGTFFITNAERPLADDMVVDIERKVHVKFRPLVRARAYEAIGDLAVADAAYQKGLKDQPSDFVLLLAAADFYRRADHPTRAETLYTKSLDMPMPPELRARARRGLALVLATSDAKVPEAVKLVEGRTDLADERVLYYLEGLNPDHRQAAIDKLQKSLTRGPLTPDETFLLAQLLETNGQTNAAAERIQQLIDDEKDTPQMLAWLGRALVRADKADEAKPIVNRLLQREPNSPRARSLADAKGETKSETKGGPKR